MYVGQAGQYRHRGVQRRPRRQRRAPAHARDRAAPDIDDGQIDVHHQPLVDVADGRHRRASSASCGGRAPATGTSRPTSSSRWPRRPGSSSRSPSVVLERSPWPRCARWRADGYDFGICRQPLGAQPALRRPGRLRRAPPGRRRRPGDGAHPRAHRELPHRRHQPHRGAPRPAASARRAHLDRRLRHRLLVAQLPQQAPRRRAQDRPLLRRSAMGAGGRRLRHRPGRHPPRPRPRAHGRRRGRRGRRHVAVARRRRLRRRAGLPRSPGRSRPPSSPPGSLATAADGAAVFVEVPGRMPAVAAVAAVQPDRPRIGCRVSDIDLRLPPIADSLAWPSRPRTPRRP